MQDILRRNRQAQQTIQPDPTAFLEILATFRALIGILFGTISPLYIDINEVYQVCLDGHRDGYLDALRNRQADWFAHVLWAIMCATRSFFQTALRQDQLAQGIQLQCPFRNILPTIRAFTLYMHPTTPEELKPQTPGNQQNQDNRRRPNLDQELPNPNPTKWQQINQAGPLRSHISATIY